MDGVQAGPQLVSIWVLSVSGGLSVGDEMARMVGGVEVWPWGRVAVGGWVDGEAAWWVGRGAVCRGRRSEGEGGALGEVESGGSGTERGSPRGRWGRERQKELRK